MTDGTAASVGQNARQLAKVVRQHFRHRQVPTLDHLSAFFECVFFASLKKDEARPVRCSIAVLDPSHPDAESPALVRLDRWTVARLESPLPMSVENISRLSQAIPPSSGALAVWFTDGGWTIWAAIDQEHVVHEFRQHADSRYYPRAGRFQVEITDVGCISVYHDSALLAQLRREQVVAGYQDALQLGPVAQLLQPYLDAHVSAVIQAAESLPRKTDEKPVGVPVDFIEHVLDRARADWINALCRVLMEIRRQGHGGALLVLPRARWTGLNVGYRLAYPRLSEALVETGVARLLAISLDSFGIRPHRESIPATILKELDEARRRERDAGSAMTGAVRFIGALSGVDGLVALVGGLDMRGFGVEIKTKKDPASAFAALDAEGTKTERLDPASFGTRHRSMMRYCFAHPGCVGFVVSQDGDVRVMAKVGDDLLFWANLNLEGDALGMFQMHCPHCSALSDLLPAGCPEDDEPRARKAQRGQLAPDPSTREPTPLELGPS